MKKSKQENKGRILPMKKKRGRGESVSPTEVTKDLFTDIWKDHVDEVRTMAGELQSEKLASLKRKAKSVSEVLNKAKGPARLSLFKSNE
ncbi:DUF3253 domain-containing protein [Gracilimonas sp.]|uniref:DUF3253 domain-containing protein n=1 Tax=Gracilimonas sp. TaxID=1974203 RepID=UPI0032ED0E45